jgi:hypothetical protein
MVVGAGVLVGAPAAIGDAGRPPPSRATLASRHVTRCKTFTVKRVQRGRAVRLSRRQCVNVPSTECRVSWRKQRRHGRVVVRRGIPVYVAHVRCPARAGPGSAAVAVYAITAQGATYQDYDLDGAIPPKSYTEIEGVQQQGYLIRLLTPVSGLNGPASDEVGVFLGSLVELGPRAGTTQFATNTLMFSAANPSDPSLFDQLPFPYDIGHVTVRGNALTAITTLQDIEGVTPPGGKSPDYFVDRTGLIAGTIKSANAAVLAVQFAGGGRTVSGVFDIQGFTSLTTPGFVPGSESGLIGMVVRISGTRVTPNSGARIYLPPPLPRTPRPRGCRTELHLVPNLADGTLSERLETVCR